MMKFGSLRAERLLVCAAAAGALIISATGARGKDIAVDLQLVLAVDVSSSMKEQEQTIQRSGYVTALSDPLVARAILSGPLQRIAIAYLEWAGPNHQHVLVPWRLIDGIETARRFAAELNAKPIMGGTGTSISAGLRYAAGLFANSGYETRRRVIDLSGDGPNNMGPHLVPTRDVVISSGIVINGLPIMVQPSPTGYAARPDLADYFRDCVIGGPGAFVMPANSVGEIADTIRQKLIQEIAAREEYIIHVAAKAASVKTDCMIGQKEFHE